MKKNFNKTLDDVQGGFSLSSDIAKCNFFQAKPGGKGGGGKVTHKGFSIICWTR